MMAHRAFGAMVENRRGGSEEAQKDLDAIDWAIATIQSKIARPQPDPATGMKGCLFCKVMNDYKALQIDPAFAYEYTAAIVSRLYKDGNPRARATSTYYGNGKYVLNYCPMCGRKLEVEG